MKQDIILCGVGGQGIISIANVIDNAAMKDGLNFKQAEVHGMSQRGGAVQSNLRLSDGKIWSDIIPRGGADIVLSVEPLEALRYLNFLKPDGAVVTGATPFKNIGDYPDIEAVLAELRKIGKNVIIDAEKAAREAGNVRAQNMVLLGAASRYLALKEESLRASIELLFGNKGPAVIEVNLKAFDMGKSAAS